MRLHGALALDIQVGYRPYRASPPDPLIDRTDVMFGCASYKSSCLYLIQFVLHADGPLIEKIRSPSAT